MKRSFKLIIAAIFVAALAGCATTGLTVDDGRKLDDKLLSDMKAYGAGAAALRPAIVRSAAVSDRNCSIQYELPFEAITAYGVEDPDAKIAWVRALGVNENLTVIAADTSSAVAKGDIITEVAGYKPKNTLKMVRALVDARNRGQSFRMTLASGRQVLISPITVCQGHTTIASPLHAATQNYHWTQSIHPLEVFHQALTPDEAIWIVLWTQGLSEQSGAAMKAYAFIVGSVKWIARIALGFATGGATAAVRGAAAAAGSSAAAGQIAAAQLAGQAASLMASAAANRASLSGINGIAAGRFDQADKWAFENMIKLGMNPLAGLTLHEKLVAQGAAANAFLLDEKRLAGMQELVAGLPDDTATVKTATVKPPPDLPERAPQILRFVPPAGFPDTSRDNRSDAGLDVRNANSK
jgi:hypothetical protein